MQEIRSSGGLEHHYSIKIINPLDRGGYEVHSMDSHVIFNQVSDLNQAIVSSCEEYIQKDKGVKFGYVVPGHGKKGKQIVKRISKKCTRYIRKDARYYCG